MGYSQWGGGDIYMDDGGTQNFSCSSWSTTYFYDSGGPNYEYSNDEDYVLTICPSSSGYRTRVDFNSFNVEAGFDYLEVYNGSSTSDPLMDVYDNDHPPSVVQATESNSSGCLTFVFHSDGSVTYDGWEAVLSCIAPCQEVDAVLDDTDPDANNGYIDLCQGESVTFSGSGNYPENYNYYYQSDNTSTFVWYFDNGQTDTGQTVTHTFTEGGGTDVQLVVIDVNGCRSTNNINLRVRVSTTPSFDGTNVTDPICSGDCADLNGVVTPTHWESHATLASGGTTYLPDGSGVEYTDTIIFTSFDQGQTLDDYNDLESICLNMEHSYMGDLSIEIECPNGQTLTLLPYSNNGGGTILGEPVATDLPVDGNTDDPTPGIGYDYCWSPSSTNGYIDDESNWTNVSPYTDPEGNVSTSDPINQANPGTYQAYGDWSSLVGCPLNGAWVIHVTDHMSADNGYIFHWEISFDPSIIPSPWGFTPSIVSEDWDGENVSNSNNQYTACPSELGSHTYTYTVTDNFGCSYDTSLSLNVVGFTLSENHTNVTCNGSNDGVATVSIASSTGTSSYTYDWGFTSVGPTSSTSNTQSGLAAGTYTVTVTSNTGCTNTIDVVITEPPAISITGTTTDESCDNANDGSIDISVSGGTSPYTYNWSNGANTEDISNLADGSYSVTVTDNTGCTQTASFTINPGQPIVASFTPPSNQCLDGNSFTFDASGSSTGSGISYSWDFGDGNTSSGSTVTHTYGSDGTYTVTLTVSNGTCTDQDSHDITVYPQPSVTFSNVTDPSCYGSTDGEATANGGTSYQWDSNAGNQTTATATGLGAGTYTVTVTSSVGCSSTGTVTLNEPAELQVTVARNNVTCNGGNDGSAQAQITQESTPPYDYQWSTGSQTLGTNSTTDNVSGLTAGTYDVTVTDANGCSKVVSFVISEPSAFSVTTDHTDAHCGQPDGSASVTVSGATSPYSYNWSNGTTSSSISNVTSGTYTVTITDAAGCTDVESIDISDIGGPTVQITSTTDVSCNGTCDGAATATITTTSTGPYDYDWSNGNSTSGTSSTTNIVSSLCAGTISVTLTDAAGCASTATANISEPTTIQISTDSIVDANCGNSNGSIYITVSGGTPDYSYNWSDGSTSEDLTNKPSGSYDVTVTDSHGCTQTASFTIGDTPGPEVDIRDSQDPLCHGDCNGWAIAQITNTSTPPYTYTWSTGESRITPQIFDTTEYLCGNTWYYITVTDNNGCSDIDSVLLSEPDELSLSVYPHSDVSCHNGSDGNATVNISGGTNPYSILWSTGATNNTINNVPAGTYTVTVTDNNGCTADTSVTIEQPNLPVITLVGQDPTCGFNNGSITAEVTNAPTPLSYSWNTGDTDNPIDSLAAGTYSVTVTDAHGCTVEDQITLTDIPGPTATISNVVNVSCYGNNDGSITVSASGGSSPYTYTWSNGQTGVTDTNLTAGWYYVTVTDTNGCQAIDSAEVIQPDQLTTTINDYNLSCNGDCNGSLTVNVSGGTQPYTYQWDDATLSTTATINNLCAGKYHVTVTDSNGCQIIDSANVIEPNPIVITAQITDAVCNQPNGSIDATAIGGTPPYDFGWSNGDTTSSTDSLAAGTYTLVVTDANGCHVDTTFSVIDAGSPVATISDYENVDCNGNCNGTATVVATGGTGPGTYTYNWSDGQNTPIATNLCAGNYYVIVSDTNGCTSTAYVTITEPPVLGYNLSTTDVSCFGECNGSATVTPYGGTPPYSYNWTGGGSSPNDSTNTQLCAGTYSVEIIDSNGCNIIDNNVSITQPTQISLTVSVTDETCAESNDGTATVNATGGTPPYTYLWDNNANNQTTATATNLDEGTYYVTVTDAHGCTQTISATVSSPDPLIFTSVTSQDLNCYMSGDGEIHVTVSGGTPNYTYHWENNISPSWSASTQDLTNLDAGTYFLTVTDNNGCQIDTTVIISQPVQLSLTLSKTDETCHGLCDGSITAFVTGGTPPSGPYHYNWSTLDTTSSITNLCPGNYSLTVTDDNGCTITGSETITGPPALIINVDNVEDATCGDANGSISISLSGGTGVPSIEWSANAGGQNSTTINNLSSGNYCVTVTDENGCETDTCIGINNIGGPIINGFNVENVTCNGASDGTITVNYSYPSNAATPYTILWSTGDTSQTITNLPSGNYSVTITDANNCSAIDNAYVDEPDPLNVIIGNVVDNTCYGDCNGSAATNVTGGTPPYNYSWSNGQTTENASGLCAGTYTLTVTDANNCTQTSSVTITEPQPIVINLDYIQNVSCTGYSDGVISITPTGGSGSYIYNWLNANSTGSVAGGLSAGTYTVVVSDANDNSCSTDTSFTVTEPEPLYVSLGSEPTTCGNDNGRAFIDSLGGGTAPYSWNWSPCSSGCNDSSITNIATGYYYIQVFDVNGCSTIDSIAVLNIPPPHIEDIITHDVSCYGGNDGSAEVVHDYYGTQPFTYQWSSSPSHDSIATGLSAGTHTVTLVDANGCTDFYVFQINEPDPVEVYGYGPQAPVCIGQQVNIYAVANGGSAPYTYIWSDSSFDSTSTQQVTVDSSITFYVSAMDSNGCMSLTQAAISIQVYPPLDVSVSGETDICEGDAATLLAIGNGGNGGPYSYIWDSGDEGDNIDVFPNSSRYFTVSVYDNCGTPPASDSIYVNVHQYPKLIDLDKANGCQPLRVNFSPQIWNPDSGNTISYSWDFGDYNSPPSSNFSNDSTPIHIYNYDGTYNVSLTLTSDYGCSHDTVLNNLVTVYPTPMANFAANPTATGVFSADINFTDYSEGDIVIWSWNFGDSTMSTMRNPFHSYSRPGDYLVSLIVVSDKGCKDTAWTKIQIYPETTFYPPTAFTPGSGYGNEYFYPKGIGISDKGYHMYIYDRWGELIYESDVKPAGTDQRYEVEGGWNGRFNNTGNYVPAGVYVWLIEFKNAMGEKKRRSGTVTVIR